jgi:molecular chaperone DnaK (HSP70)
MARDAFRYYAYSPTMGRRRVPCTTEADAIIWAAVHGAVNVVREDGPASKPTAVTIVWKRDEPTPFDLHADIYQELADRFPKATVREISEAVAAVEAIFKEHG